MWLFEYFVAIYFALPQRDSHAMCKNTEKSTGLIRGPIKHGGEIGLVPVSTSKTQQQLAQYHCHTQFPSSHSQWPHPSLFTNKWIFLHYNHTSENIRPWSSNSASKARKSRMCTALLVFISCWITLS